MIVAAAVVAATAAAVAAHEASEEAAAAVPDAKDADLLGSETFGQFAARASDENASSTHCGKDISLLFMITVYLQHYFLFFSSITRDVGKVVLYKM